MSPLHLGSTRALIWGVQLSRIEMETGRNSCHKLKKWGHEGQRRDILQRGSFWLIYRNRNHCMFACVSKDPYPVESSKQQQVIQHKNYNKYNPKATPVQRLEHMIAVPLVTCKVGKLCRLRPVPIQHTEPLSILPKPKFLKRLTFPQLMWIEITWTLFLTNNYIFIFWGKWSSYDSIASN